MKNIKRFIPALMAGVSIFALAKVDLLNPAYDFGVMKETEGPKTGKSLLVNSGSNPIQITDVRPSCGCTGADFQSGVIAPGDTAWVSFTYDPDGRPGKFEKTVRIFVKDDNDSTERKVVKISGTVLGKPASLDRYYPIELGPLRVTEKTILFGNLRKGTARHFFIKAYNQTLDTVHPMVASSDPKAMDVSVIPKAVGPGEVATIAMYLNARYIAELGPKDYTIILTPDSLKPTEKFDIEVKANITETP